MFGNNNYGSSYNNMGYGNMGYGSPYMGRGSFTGDFAHSNNLVAKISFLLLSVFVFIILLQLAISFMVWFFSPGNKQKLINGMVDGKNMIIIPQDPKEKNSRTLSRSKNNDDGIEFTWSCWIFIDDLKYLSGKYRHIFHKGNDKVNNQTGLNFPNNAPGLYISPNTNELTVIMNTFQVINQEITIPDIPLNKWINVMIRCKNTTIDIYINGTITKSVKLKGVPKQNYGDVFVAMNGGFSGYISDLTYFNYGLGISQIQNIIKTGPNLTYSSNGALKNTKNNDYLSLRWYFYGDN